MDRILQEHGIEGRQLSWEALGWEAGLEDISSATIKRAMGSMNYYKFVACRKGWVPDRRNKFIRNAR
jgi:hypothetical protein